LLNIEELVNAAVEAEQQGETLQDFIDHAALVADTDQYKADARVTLMTMHSAKGLEFPLVFIVGLEEGLFPHSRASASDDDLEEERRLCYVAITRAQKYLYITHAMQRRIFGEADVTEPSRFLNELPLELMQNLSQGASWLGFAEKLDTKHNREAVAALRGEHSSPVKKTSNYEGKTYNSVDGVREFFKNRTGSSGGPSSRGSESYSHRKIGQRRDSGRDRESADAQSSSGGQFKVGARVKHERYGTGVVLRSEGAGDDAKLTVSFPGYGQKKFVAKFAALEKA
jgi:DNA helicase-2/ATP-dependent DNA helicase PcrA